MSKDKCTKLKLYVLAGIFISLFIFDYAQTTQCEGVVTHYRQCYSYWGD
jgi:hypothetical protein